MLVIPANHEESVEDKISTLNTKDTMLAAMPLERNSSGQ